MLSTACARTIPLGRAFFTASGSSVGNAGRVLLVQSVGRPAIRQYARGVRGSQFSARPGTFRQTGAKTLRERMWGPTTGRPYQIGTLAVAGASALGVGALCFYGLGLSSDVGILEKSAIWPQFVRDRVHTTYTYLGGSLALTAASAMAVARNPTLLRMMAGNSLWVLFGSLAAVIGTGYVVQSIPYREGFGAKQLAWMLHTGTLGAVLAPMCLLGGPLLVRAACYTAGIVGGLSAIAVCAPSERFLNMAGPLGMGLGVVFVSSIGTWFMPPHTALGAGLWSIAIYGGLILFSGFLLYDTQRVVKHAEHYPVYANRPFDPVNAQISLYLDILNIFMRMAMILGMGGNRRK